MLGTPQFNHFLDLSGLNEEQLQAKRAEIQRRIAVMERNGIISQDQFRQLKVIDQQIVDEMHDRMTIKDSLADGDTEVIEIGGAWDSGLNKKDKDADEPDRKSGQRRRRKSHW